MRYLFILLLGLTSCTKTFQIEENGVITSYTAKTKDIISIKDIIQKYETSFELNTTQSCEHSGACCKCGLTLGMDYECSCGIWRNCEGSQRVKLKITPYTYRTEYQIKKDKIQTTQKLTSPLYKDKKVEVLEESTCS